MAHDDEALDPTSLEPASANHSGTDSTPAPTDESVRDEIHDDDALADALAAEYTLLATAAIPIVSISDYPDYPDDDGMDVPTDDVVPNAAGVAAAPPIETDAAHEAPVVAPEPASSPEETAVAATFVSPFDPPTPARGAPDPASAPWSVFPAPDPTQAVNLPDGPPAFLAAAPVEQWPAPSFDEPAADAPTERVVDQPEERAPESEVISTVPSWEPTPWEPAPHDEEPAPHDEEFEPEQAHSEPIDVVDAVAAAVPERTEVNAGTAWPPEVSEWDAATEAATESESTAERESEPEPAAEPERAGEPEEFPWIVAAAAAAAAPPLVAPVDKDPFNWSITATGKVAYLDEPTAEAGAVEEPESSSPEQPLAEFNDVQAATVPTGPPQLAVDPDPQPRFLPPTLVEPVESPLAEPETGGLPIAPPAYLPVEHREPPVLASPPPAPPFGAPVSSTTGSVDVVGPAYDVEPDDDDVDDTDRFFAQILAGSGDAPLAASTLAVAPPSGPIPTARLADDEPVFFDDEPMNPGVFSLESAGLEPTAVEYRAGHAVRLFWLWFSANSSIISVALGASVFLAGMSLRQSIVAILGGVALSLFPLALTTLAGKRSAQPTMVVSRATFGVLGNVVPAVLAVISRLFWGGVLLWLLAVSVAAVLITTGVRLDAQPLALITLAVAFILALAVACVGYPLLARIQLFLTVIAVVLIVGLIALTVQYVDIPQALTVEDGSWVLAVGGAVLVFSFVGLVWAFSGADLARYQRPGSSGASSMLAAGFGTAIPAFVLVGYGAVLAASDTQIAEGFATQPVQTLAGLLPSWYPVPLVAAIALSLLSGVIITMYSGGFALQSVGLHVSRSLSVVVIGIVLAGIAVLLTVTLSDGLAEVFRDLATTLAVPTAAWIGIFGSEMMIRNRRFNSESLLKRGGLYADARWVNLAGLVVISVIGFGMTTATVSWLSWQGFGFTLLGIDLGADLASTDLGVLVALVLGLLLPLVTGVPAIRRQEAARA